MEKQFQQAIEQVMEKERVRNGIGTLGEKTLHAVLKRFYEPDETCQEIKIGNYVADIFRAGEIIEIQTRSFNAMRKKLDFFLESYHVTIVYPIPHVKWLVWVDEETGEVTKRRKSPKTGNVFQAFPELYRIKNFLKNPHLHFCFPLIDMEEQRLLNGWSRDKKKGSTRFDRIPLSFYDEIYVHGIEEFDKLLPQNLEEPFTVKQFAKEAKLSPNAAGKALNVLYFTETVDRVGKKRNAYLYKKRK